MTTPTLRILPSFAALRPLTLASALSLSLILTAGAAQAMGNQPQANDDEGIASRIQPVGRVVFADTETASAAASEDDDASASAEAAGDADSDAPVAAVAAAKPARAGDKIYNSSCSACHMTGAAGAPTTGDKAAWEPRLAKGLDGLLASAIKGLNAMPPRGGSNATDLELARAIVYMANKSGGNLTEPAE